MGIQLLLNLVLVGVLYNEVKCIFYQRFVPNFRTSIEDTLELKGYLTVTGQSYIHIPYGITANRPAGGPVGSLRVNTTTGNLEFFNGTDWGSV